MSKRPPHLRASRPWARVIQSSAFVRKELVEIFRQPRLLALLVVGPFALLLLFGAGYRNEDLRMRTLFVGPAGSFYEDAVADHQEDLERFVEPQGFTDDIDAARARLDDGDVDAVVVFPADPLDTVLAGEQAEIEVLHDKIDPIQQTAIEVAARLAVQEVNAQVVAAVVASGQDALRPVDDVLAALTAAGGQVAAAAAAGDPTAAADAADTVSTTAAELRELVAGTDVVLTRLGAADDGARRTVLDRLDELRADAAAIAAEGGADLTERAETLAARLDDVATAMPDVAAIDPTVIVQPFEAVTESTVPERIEPIDFFAPSAIALLLQHIAVTFAALSLVRDRELGLFELLRVGPLTSWEIVTGKTIAYLLVGMHVGVGLLEGAVHLLGVPLVGAAAWTLVAFALVLLASLALGTIISLLSGTETQAVQWAMLTLLAGLFFSGFVLSLDGMTFPVKAIAYVLPVTYGIRILQDVMLRGAVPATEDLLGVGALVLAYGAIAILLLRRQLRTA
jgi:ABC-2 type transport system permease protein